MTREDAIRRSSAISLKQVHSLLDALLAEAHVPYFRFNPQIPPTALDETDSLKLAELQAIANEFMTRGGGASDCVALSAIISRPHNSAHTLLQHCSEWIVEKLGRMFITQTGQSRL